MTNESTNDETTNPETKLEDLEIPATTPALSLRNYTPARVALHRTGVSLTTTDILDFQLAHAQARDAVHAALAPEHLANRLRTELPSLTAPILTLASAAPDRVSYLHRPDLGRTLAPASAALLHPSPCDLVIVLADGLSATAVEHHAIPLLAALLPALPQNQTLGPVCIATQARVAIADQIGSLLQARLSLILIGERPGLSSPDSLGAYITWNPAPGRTDADRNCISNIRTAGLDYATAAARIAFYCAEAHRLQLTGTTLKETTQPQLNP
ncbi:ethanolamine ammonia-lyase subunit EutC [Tunturibacter empetritectus]|uniref:Ethanolamine ammonia-lyase small subunit n=1 Tax=Tunturiibacter empetritectus TaxID=3069691 RepID=A0A7W8IKW7_9BACT|nr:ethanolamine ammonia-lyase subunit EutC [Edaphobacter lichenicola]MBB5319059.1 ethanolamine ammonia-lyase small subunit [Edaphobacter lichenicola]